MSRGRDAKGDHTTCISICQQNQPKCQHLWDMNIYGVRGSTSAIPAVGFGSRIATAYGLRKTPIPDTSSPLSACLRNPTARSNRRLKIPPHMNDISLFHRCLRTGKRSRKPHEVPPSRTPCASTIWEDIELPALGPRSALAFRSGKSAAACAYY